MKSKTYGLTKKENNTYHLISRENKELIGEQEILEHWNKRAEREDVQTVMSARHSLEDNINATIELQKEIKNFLGNLMINKNIFEMGVGIGRMTQLLARNNNSIYGIDISRVMLNKAEINLNGFKNIKLILGKITQIEITKRFDLVFDSIVLLHILNFEELKKTISKMQELSDNIFLVEHTYEGENFLISRYSILRKFEEYESLFKPYKLIKIALKWVLELVE